MNRPRFSGIPPNVTPIYKVSEVISLYKYIPDKLGGAIV